VKRKEVFLPSGKYGRPLRRRKKKSHPGLMAGWILRTGFSIPMQKTVSFHGSCPSLVQIKTRLTFPVT
jgi:hypothetical protein